MKKVRTRFAPSPTGYMHIGNLRTALYEYLLAKANGGDFILRIEDTDQERYVEGAIDLIYKTMHETGLAYDEGPDIGGDFGPYVQSERRDIYKKYAEQLVELGGAYYCFCDDDTLHEMREAQKSAGQTPKYDGRCKNLTPEEIQEKLASGVPYVIRQKIPSEGQTSFDDAVYGRITVENAELDENVLLKSDGLPTYNFANVVDDHLMEITHVVRGSEYLSSTPKYNLLYDSFGWEKPVYVHVSQIVKEGGVKYSKRNGDPSYEDFINMGYLKDALINFIALLGWSPGGEEEIYSLDELCRVFSVHGISKSPAVFDFKKLDWMNGEYIRKLTPEEFYEHAKPYIDQAVKSETADKKYLATLLQKRCEKFSDIPENLAFVDQVQDYEPDLYFSKKMKTNAETAKEYLPVIKTILEQTEDWTEQGVYDALMEYVNEKGIKNGLLMSPLRVALSGQRVTPGGGCEIACIIGKEETLSRLDMAIEKLR